MLTAQDRLVTCGTAYAAPCLFRVDMTRGWCPQDVVACLQSEVAVKDLLAEKVGELEGELEQMRQAATEAMQSSQQLESERLTNLQWEMQV